MTQGMGNMARTGLTGAAATRLLEGTMSGEHMSGKTFKNVPGFAHGSTEGLFIFAVHDDCHTKMAGWKVDSEENDTLKHVDGRCHLNQLLPIDAQSISDTWDSAGGGNPGTISGKTHKEYTVSDIKDVQTGLYPVLEARALALPAPASIGESALENKDQDPHAPVCVCVCVCVLPTRPWNPTPKIADFHLSCFFTIISDPPSAPPLPSLSFPRSLQSTRQDQASVTHVACLAAANFLIPSNSSQRTSTQSMIGVSAKSAPRSRRFLMCSRVIANTDLRMRCQKVGADLDSKCLPEPLSLKCSRNGQCLFMVALVMLSHQYCGRANCLCPGTHSWMVQHLRID